MNKLRKNNRIPHSLLPILLLFLVSCTDDSVTNQGSRKLSDFPTDYYRDGLMGTWLTVSNSTDSARMRFELDNMIYLSMKSPYNGNLWSPETASASYFVMNCFLNLALVDCGSERGEAWRKLEFRNDTMIWSNTGHVYELEGMLNCGTLTSVGHYTYCAAQRRYAYSLRKDGTFLHTKYLNRGQGWAPYDSTEGRFGIKWGESIRMNWVSDGDTLFQTYRYEQYDSIVYLYIPNYKNILFRIPD